MEEFVRQTLLFDFYGELLTEHQQQVFRDVYFGDMSLSEVAQIHDISRQGVHDLIKRCNRQLEAYEKKLTLVERFLDIKSKTEKIYSSTKKIIVDLSEDASVKKEDLLPVLQEMETLTQEILEEL